MCAGKEGTRKIIAGIDGHTVHGQTLRARRLMEIVPGHGEIDASDVDEMYSPAHHTTAQHLARQSQSQSQWAEAPRPS